MSECPHCHKTIDLVTTKELIEENGVSQALITDWRKKEKFPQPWSMIGGRAVWLKSDTDKYFKTWGEKKVERVAESLTQTVARLQLTDQEIEQLLTQVREGAKT